MLKIKIFLVLNQLSRHLHKTINIIVNHLSSRYKFSQIVEEIITIKQGFLQNMVSQELLFALIAHILKLYHQILDLDIHLIFIERIFTA